MNEERRQQLVEQARRLHSQGKFGGAQFGKLGGRPRKPRLGELLAQRAAENADVVWAAFMAAMGPGRSARQRAEAAERLARVVGREAELAARESRDGHHAAVDLVGLSDDELRAYLAGRLRELAPSGPAELLSGEVIESQ